MVASNGSGAGLAQVGYGRSPGQGERTFSEWSNTSGSEWDRTYHFGVWSAGTDHAYKVRYNASTNREQMLIGADVVDQTTFDPKNSWADVWNAQFMGETHDPGDDVPGTPGHRADFDQLKTQNCETCDFNAPDDVQTVSSGPSAYKFNWVNQPTHSQIWTDR